MSDPAPYRFHHTVEVRFRDLDAMGHAHHSLPLIYAEEARAAYWRDIAGRQGLDGIDYVLAEVTVRYHRRITFPGTLDIGLRINRLGDRSFGMEFEIRARGTGDLLASGQTVQVAFDYEAGRSMALSDDVRARIERFERGD
ncbi:MAG: acyl-CoA thioesterase [Longimicrobiales bacterium]